ncbi:MAG: PfkB family carbohydrate kinase [Myxococcota bacterium]|nr:PfkB family carbohydrate kinase [Myxococcota bacterium]
MIVTVTVNPMIEQFHEVPGFAAGETHRPESAASVVASGKPLNVARALRDLGEEVVAVVATGGSTGQEILERLEAEHLESRHVRLSQESRRGFTVFGGGRTSTVYGPAPAISDAEADAIVALVKSLLPARFLVVGGSTSRTDLYPRLCGLDAQVVLDSHGHALLDSLAGGGVHLAKPNLKECRFTLGTEDVEHAVQDLVGRGAQEAVVTDEGGAAAFSMGGRQVMALPPAVDVVHTVGCGDALCAGLLHMHERPMDEAVAFAMACGAHAASRPEVARLDKAACIELAGRVELS